MISVILRTWRKKWIFTFVLKQFQLSVNMRKAHTKILTTVESHTSKVESHTTAKGNHWLIIIFISIAISPARMTVSFDATTKQRQQGWKMGKEKRAVELLTETWREKMGRKRKCGNVATFILYGLLSCCWSTCCWSLVCDSCSANHNYSKLIQWDEKFKLFVHFSCALFDQIEQS